MRMVVVFPAPLGPRNPYTWPRGDAEIKTIYGDRRPEPLTQTLTPDRIHRKRP